MELEELIAAVSRRESLTGLQDSISSALQGELERILLEAQLESERNKDRCVFGGGWGSFSVKQRKINISLYHVYISVWWSRLESPAGRIWATGFSLTRFDIICSDQILHVFNIRMGFCYVFH